MRRAGRSGRRALRWLLFVALGAALYFGIVRRFTVRRLDLATVEAMAPALQRGAWHLIDRRPGGRLGRDWIVWWRWRGGALFSRVVGLPRERLERHGTRWTIRGETGTYPLPPEASFPEGFDRLELGDDEYLLLNDRLSAPWPDSRTVGPVARERIRARVLFSFGGHG